GTNGQAVITVPGAFSGSYYITIRHRNSLATTTAAPVSFSASNVALNLDHPSKAFGGNLLMMIDGKYVIYGGDVNQDGSVDTADMTPVDNDASAFVTGYLATDVNGDGTVDTGDMTIIDNNAAAFVSSITP
uniref:dockerin type I domain-containing protein n=1 Tax=Lentimicrobium sp. TaxID=2034841 RepID=UPI00345E65C1